MTAPSATTGVRPEPGGLQRVELAIDNLDCPRLRPDRRAGAAGRAGVSAVTVNPTSGVAFVEHEPRQAPVAVLHEALKAAGYRSGSGAKARFHIKGMTCASCVTTIEQALRATSGVLSAHVNLASEEALVEYVPATTDLGAVRAAVGLRRLHSGRHTATGEPECRRSGGGRARPRIPDADAPVVVRRRRRRVYDGPLLPVAVPWTCGTCSRGSSHQLWWMWAAMGVASLAVMLV